MTIVILPQRLVIDVRIIRLTYLPAVKNGLFGFPMEWVYEIDKGTEWWYNP